MKHYPHHIGDFDKATRHLTRLERSVYRDLLDMYYDTEKPLPKELSVVCRKIIARSNEESTAVEQVLNEFFILTEDGWFNSRCDSEIEKYNNNNSQKAMAGKASAASKALKKQQALSGNSTSVEHSLDECSTCDEQTNNGTPTNHKPSTINHKPLNTHANARDDFTPDLKTLNIMLHNAGQNYQVTQQELDQTLVTFVPHYETQQLTKNQLMGKLASWIMRDRLKPNTSKGGSVSKTPDNNTTDWMSDELLEMLNAKSN